MFKTKLNFLVRFAFAFLGITGAFTEPGLEAPCIAVPGPVIGAGLPALAIVAGGYWLLRRLRDR